MKGRYRHKQIGTWTIIILLGAGAIVAPIALSALADEQTTIAILIIILYFLILALFYALTVEISGGKLSFWFGIGLIRKSYPVEEILTAAIVKSPWYYLWGIKSIPDGWLYAIGPGTAVEIVLKNGKMFRLGTDEPQRLKEAIGEAAGSHTLLGTN